MTDIQVKIKTTYQSDINIVTIKSDAKVEDIMKEIEKYLRTEHLTEKLRSNLSDHGSCIK